MGFGPLLLSEEVGWDMTMSGIWTKDGDGWTLSPPEGFPDEATLHSLIVETPEMLPLSGAPPLAILGREVPLGSGYADLVGVETSGRPVIIEAKLAYSSEARRAVVAQILAYAAHLHGTTREQLEDRVGPSLRQRDHESIVDALRSAQEDAFDDDEFTAALDEHLREGRFRLVFVLDAVPPELVTLVAYLGKHDSEYQRGSAERCDRGIRRGGQAAEPSNAHRGTASLSGSCGFDRCPNATVGSSRLSQYRP